MCKADPWLLPCCRVPTSFPLSIPVTGAFAPPSHASYALPPPFQGSSAVGEVLDLTVRTLPGDHLRPMQQAIVDLPPEVRRGPAGVSGPSEGRRRP